MFQWSQRFPIAFLAGTILLSLDFMCSNLSSIKQAKYSYNHVIVFINRNIAAYVLYHPLVTITIHIFDAIMLNLCHIWAKGETPDTI